MLHFRAAYHCTTVAALLLFLLVVMLAARMLLPRSHILILFAQSLTRVSIQSKLNGAHWYLTATALHTPVTLASWRVAGVLQVTITFLAHLLLLQVLEIYILNLADFSPVGQELPFLVDGFGCTHHFATLGFDKLCARGW